MENDPDVLEVMCVLARYLRTNPLACDTPCGISRWWLREQPFAMETLLNALERMKQDGLVEELEAADGRLRYRRLATDEQLSAVERRCRETRH